MCILNNFKILDTSAIIAFYNELKIPEILYELNDIDYNITIPISVYNELKRPTFDAVKTGVDLGKITLLDPIQTNEIKSLKDRYPYLKNGELEVILWGTRLNLRQIKYFCILDDKHARDVATKNNIVYTGTKGLIKYLAKKGIVTTGQADTLITQLQQTNFRA